MNGELVMVVWRDAHFEWELAADAELRDDYVVHTVGYIVDDGVTFLSVAAESLEDGDGWRAVTRIPQDNVHERIRLVEEPL